MDEAQERAIIEDAIRTVEKASGQRRPAAAGEDGVRQADFAALFAGGERRHYLRRLGDEPGALHRHPEAALRPVAGRGRAERHGHVHSFARLSGQPAAPHRPVRRGAETRDGPRRRHAVSVASGDRATEDRLAGRQGCRRHDRGPAGVPSPEPARQAVQAPRRHADDLSGSAPLHDPGLRQSGRGVPHSGRAESERVEGGVSDQCGPAGACSTAVVALVLIRHALFGDDGAETIGQAVHRRGAHAARGRAARHQHRIHLVPAQVGVQRRLEEGRGHPLGVDQVHSLIDPAARIEGVAFGTVFDVLQAVGRIGARAPDACVPGVGLIADMAPDHRHPLGARGGRDAVGEADLVRMGHIGRLRKQIGAGVGLLEVDVHHGQFLAEAETGAGGVGLDRLEQLARRLVLADHGRFEDKVAHGRSVLNGIKIGQL
uniref:Transcriptional regulator n=1 Tax=Parastrongyloides trichosuri TaxID=131310 RepID=A0A0N4ZL47_PARTI